MMAKFKPGQSGNPAGMKKGTKHKITLSDLNASIDRAEQTKGKKLLDHFVERAFYSDKVLVALMKKLLPDVVYRDAPEPFSYLDEKIEFGFRNGAEEYQQFLRN